MKKLTVILVVLAIIAASALPAQAYHWRYRHPVWGWGWWSHAEGPLYPPTVYVPPPVVVITPQPQPQIYIQQQPEQTPPQFVWYWCIDPQGFYPYIPQCKSAWMKVIPEMTPPTVPK